MSKIEFKTYTPAQIADNLKTLSPEQLGEVFKCLAKDNKAIQFAEVKVEKNEGKSGLPLKQVFAGEAEVKLAQKFAGEYSELTQRLEQLKINQDWLIQRTDGIHEALCPGRMGTWQERAIQAETVAHKLVKACGPIIHFVIQWERKPLAKLHDQFYGIHNGTEFQADLRLSEFKKIRDLLRPGQRTGPTVVSINGSKVTLTPDDCMALTYQRIVDLADTEWGTKALHSITFCDRATDKSGILSPGRSIVPTEGMSITAVVTGSA